MSDTLELLDIPSGHLSDTSMNMWSRCPRQYQYRYVDGLKMPPASPLILGLAAHTGLQWCFEQQVQHGTHPETAKTLERYEQAVVEKIDMMQRATGHEVEWKEGDSEQVLVDDGTKLLRRYDEDIGKDVRPQLVEQPFELGFRDTDWNLQGRIDLVDEMDNIVDFKTTGRRLPENQADIADQLTAYQVARDGAGSPPRELSIHSLVRLKRGPELQVLTAPRRSADRKHEYLENTAKIALSIRTGIFPKTNDVNGTCSWCGYSKVCRPNVWQYYQAKRAEK